ncbi:MAG: glycoside hydrolase family 20 zincin-like fold domain-containing protein [bacterium]
MRISILIGLCLLSLNLPAAETGDKETAKNSKSQVLAIGNAELAVVLGEKPSAAEKQVAELLAERIKDRAGVALAALGDKAAFRLVIGKVASNAKIKKFAGAHKEVASLGTDGYVIAVNPGSKEIHVAGQSDSGVVAGVGRLMREIRYLNGKIEVPALQIAETPQMPNRGMYLWARKHFFGKPDQVDRYIEEFALWGGNGIAFWFEMGMFKSFNDPEAQQWLAMYRRFYETARRLGMKTGLLMVANDAYASSPEELRHTMIIGNHGREHYLCPSKPGSIKQMIAWQEQVFKALQPIDIFNVFPADPGGCSCKDCTPWPTCGFWRIAKPLADRIHEISPNTGIWVDTWHLNHPTFGGKDWKNLVANLGWSKERPEWFAGFEVGLAPNHGYARMSAEDRKVYNETKQPLMVFPEISMWGNHSGMLVNKEYWKSLQTEMNDYSPELMKGGWPYSERWNTDIASVMMLSWFWNSKKPAETVLDEYTSFYFGPEAASGRELLELLDDSNTDPQRKEKIRETFAKLEGSLPEWVKRDWRWAEIVESCNYRTR